MENYLKIKVLKIGILENYLKIKILKIKFWHQKMKKKKRMNVLHIQLAKFVVRNFEATCYFGIWQGNHFCRHIRIGIKFQINCSISTLIQCANITKKRFDHSSNHGNKGRWTWKWEKLWWQWWRWVSHLNSGGEETPTSATSLSHFLTDSNLQSLLPLFFLPLQAQ